MKYSEYKSKRLKSWDYSQPYLYFVTFCTRNNEKILSEIIQMNEHSFDNVSVKLTKIGEICIDALQYVLSQHQRVRVPQFVVMPNHIHAVVDINGSEPKNEVDLITIVAQWKRVSKMMASKAGFNNLYWHRSFYDHVIRNETDLYRIIEYIENNPTKWLLKQKKEF